MKEILEQIILDFQESNLRTGIPRSLNIQHISGKVTVCMGVRRSGKSTYIFQEIEKLVKQGISKKNILYLNFFDDRIHKLQHDNLWLIVDAYYSLYPEKKNVETIYFFFDEIQTISDWEPFVDRILRTENCEIYITGSSAKLLSKEIATQMRGRALSWEIFPFSFKEFLSFKNIEYSKKMSTKKNLFVKKFFEEYWQSGSFPEVLGVDKMIRVKIHQEYFQSILFRDLIDRHNIIHPNALSDLAYKLIDNIAALYSINKLVNYLHSLGHKIPKTAVSDYLEWFEDAYFLFTVRLFDASLSRSKSNPKKIYCIDHAFVMSVSSGILTNSGHLLENLVFITLRRFSESIFYYKTRSNKEVDFIVQSLDRSKALIQVCESMKSENTRKREINALLEAMKEQELDNGIIVTRDDEEKICMDNKIIFVIPIWRFLLLNEEDVKDLAHCLSL